jgi:glycerol-3-phosphate dehydrogenase (NAD(P)+)
MSSVAVIGAGAWGTALAVQAARAGNEVILWARDQATAAAIEQSRETSRLPGVRLAGAIRVTANLPHHADLILLAVPMQHMRGVVAMLPVSQVRSSRAPLVICAKGVEAGTLRLPLEVIAEQCPETPAVVLTGPNFAHEVAAGLPAASVVAGVDPDVRNAVTARLATPAFRLYGNDDPVGAQIGGAAKNVIAIAAGAVIGAGLGENARAAVITRGLAELGRLVVALGGRQETVMGLSGLGDLLLTCTGPSSRNFSLGLALGRGEALADILANRQSVTEGVTTAPALVERARQAGGGLDLPICGVVSAFLAGHTTLAQAMADLLARPRRDE